MGSGGNSSYSRALRDFTENIVRSRLKVISGVLVLFALIVGVYYDTSRVPLDKKLLKILHNYPEESSIECPRNFRVYHLSYGRSVYSLHVESQLDGEQQQLRFCRISSTGDEQKGEENEELRQLTTGINSTSHGRSVQRWCQNFKYMGANGQKEVVKEPLKDDYNSYFEDGNNLEDGSKGSLIRLHPGTLQCGSGPSSSQFGVNTETDKCCIAHDACRPKMRLFNMNVNLEHTSITSLAYCSCDVELYNCLRRQKDSVADKIAQKVFNELRMKCFEFGKKDVCAWQVFGSCFHYEKHCIAIMRDNAPY